MHFSWTFDIANPTLDLIAVGAAIIFVIAAVAYVGREIYRHYTGRK